MDPKTLAWWLILAALVYLVWPYDLLPDFFGLPGRIDDLLVIGWLAWLYHQREPARSAGPSVDPRGEAGPKRASSSTDARARAGEAFDPYAVLGIDRSASHDVIRDAYRARMREYHPDKVAHLGEALQSLAHEKSQEIQRAYRALRD